MAAEVGRLLAEHLPGDCAALVLAYLRPGGNPFYWVTADRRAAGPWCTAARAVAEIEARTDELWARLLEHAAAQPLRRPRARYVEPAPASLDEWLGAEPEPAGHWRLMEDAHRRRETAGPRALLRRLAGHARRLAAWRPALLDAADALRALDAHLDAAQEARDDAGEELFCREARARRELLAGAPRRLAPAPEPCAARAAFFAMSLARALWGLGARLPERLRPVALLQPNWECARADWPTHFFNAAVAVHACYDARCDAALHSSLLRLRVREEEPELGGLRLLMEDGAVSPLLRFPALLALARQRLGECRRGLRACPLHPWPLGGETERFDATAFASWLHADHARAPLHVWLPLLRAHWAARPSELAAAYERASAEPRPWRALHRLRVWILAERLARLSRARPPRRHERGALGEWEAARDCREPLALLVFRGEQTGQRAAASALVRGLGPEDAAGGEPQG